VNLANFSNLQHLFINDPGLFADVWKTVASLGGHADQFCPAFRSKQEGIRMEQVSKFVNSSEPRQLVITKARLYRCLLPGSLVLDIA